MKKMKKLLSVLLSLIIVMTMGFSNIVHGANLSLPPDKGDLTIHKYMLDNMSEAGGAGVGKELSDSELPANAKPVEGVAFDVYTIDTSTDVPLGGGVTYALVGGKLVVNDNGTTKQFDITLKSQIKTNILGIAKWSDLPRGYYFVVENLAASTPKVAGTAVTIGSSVAPFVVPVPMTNPDGNGWITDVHAYPKNQPLTVTKEVDDTSVNIGDEVTYTIIPSVPSDIKTSKVYKIVDQLDEALTYKTNSVHVYDVKADGTVDKLNEIPAANYTVSHTAGKLTVEFTAAGREALDGKSKIAVEFKANVNAKVLEKVKHEVENQATVEFTNSHDQESKPGSNIVKTHTGSIKITKTDDKSTPTTLGGAKFKIAASEADALAGNYLKKDSDGNIVKPGDTGFASANDWEVETASSGANKGIAIFEGVEDYTGTPPSVTYKKYWIVETKAPDGYNLLSKPIEVEFDGSATEANAYTYSKTVVNTTKFVLPNTGGQGTLIFTVVGIVIIGLAGILLVSSKKKKDNQ